MLFKFSSARQHRSAERAREGKETLGRRKVVLDAETVAALRRKGLGWKKISKELGVGIGTVLRIAQNGCGGGSKNYRCQNFRTPVHQA
jgi:DNA invertase Pin-like site-specific DNA recombinase